MILEQVRVLNNCLTAALHTRCDLPAGDHRAYTIQYLGIFSFTPVGLGNVALWSSGREDPVWSNVARIRTVSFPRQGLILQAGNNIIMEYMCRSLLVFVMTETVQPMESTADALSLYEVLGCSKQASSSELKTAYRKLALQLHPDKNMGDRKAAERFQAVSRAYDVLGDPQKRQFYDNNGITEELDVSAEDWMASFTEMVHEFTGGMPIKVQFSVLGA